jgi:O-antigen ligase
MTRSVQRKLLLLLALLFPWIHTADHEPSITAHSMMVANACFSLWWFSQRATSRIALSEDGALLVMALALASIVNAALAMSQLFLGLCPGVSACTDSNSQVWGALLQKNQFASLMALGLLAVLIAWQNRWMDQKLANATGLFGRVAWILSVGCIAFLALAAATSASRTGALQWVFITSFFILYRGARSHTKGLAIFALLAYLGFTLMLPWLLGALPLGTTGLLGRADDPNAFSRIALWSNVVELIAQKPWLGHGWRSLAYAHYSTEFSGVRFMELLDNAHNLPLHLAVELGLPAAAAFCGLVGWLIWKNRPWAESRADRQLAWGILMVIGIHSLVEYPLWYGPFFMTALICVGILCGDVWRKWLLGITESAQSAINLGIKAFAVVLLACTAFAAFDYHRVSQIYLQPEERSEWYKADALGAAQRSVLFQSHAKFAELVITPMSRENAPRILALSSELVEWSPESRVIEKLIESATMMELSDVAAFHLRRYKMAYPQAYAAWSRSVL